MTHLPLKDCAAESYKYGAGTHIPLPPSVFAAVTAHYRKVHMGNEDLLSIICKKPCCKPVQPVSGAQHQRTRTRRMSAGVCAGR